MLSTVKMIEIIKEKDFERQKEMIDSLPESERSALLAEAEKLIEGSKRLIDNRRNK